jgi:hypothetical protein
MMDLSGPKLDKIVSELRVWYVETKVRIIEQMSKPYPYGAVPLTPDEQYSNFLTMTPEDWLTMRMALMNLYHGHPDSINLVEQEINRYVQRMQAYGRNYRPGGLLNAGP